jgi:hypothetical protein
MIAIGIWGFFPYFGPLLTQGTVPSRFQHWGIHLHSAVNMCWMFLYTALAVLAWRRRIDLHRRFGPHAAAYGVLVTVVGCPRRSFYAHIEPELAALLREAPAERGVSVSARCGIQPARGGRKGWSRKGNNAK